MSKRLTRAHISLRDLRKAATFLEQAEKYARKRVNARPLELEALLLSAIVSYAKPFTNNEARGQNSTADRRLTIDAAQVLNAADDLRLHEDILKMRNKVVAHSDSEYYPVRWIPGVRGMRGSLYHSQTWSVMHEPLDLDAFARIVKKMSAACSRILLDAKSQNP